MDIMMPVMNGYETIRAIRAIDRFKDLPIIAVTGKVVAGERDRCLEAGANEYVPKPIDTARALRGAPSAGFRRRRSSISLFGPPTGAENSLARR